MNYISYNKTYVKRNNKKYILKKYIIKTIPKHNYKIVNDCILAYHKVLFKNCTGIPKLISNKKELEFKFEYCGKSCAQILQKKNINFNEMNMILDGKDLYNRIDLDPEDEGNNETIVAKIKTESWPLPLFLRLGISKQFQIGENISLLSTSDFIIPSDDAEAICTGIELNIIEIIALRVGYNSTLNDYKDEYLTFGFGIKTKLNKFPINIDYSFQNRNLLNQTSTLGLSFSF